jgi:hypothetical protein
MSYMKPKKFIIDETQLIVLEHEGLHIVAEVKIETKVPETIKDEDEICSYLLEDYEDGCD